VIVEEFKKHYISDEMGGREDEEGAGNVGCEHEKISSECEIEDGNCEDTEVEINDRNGEHSETGEAE
jgi:hypothetical protein